VSVEQLVFEQPISSPVRLRELHCHSASSSETEMDLSDRIRVHFAEDRFGRTACRILFLEFESQARITWFRERDLEAKSELLYSR
jgi:hypothetical protein